MPKGNPNPQLHLENLKPFPPGRSANPGGRPKRLPISDRYRDHAEQILPERIRAQFDLPKDATWGDMIVLSQFMQAAKGKTDATREIREAIEGKALQRLRLEGADAGPVQIEEMSEEDLDKRIAELEERILKRTR